MLQIVVDPAVIANNKDLPSLTLADFRKLIPGEASIAMAKVLGTYLGLFRFLVAFNALAYKQSATLKVPYMTKFDMPGKDPAVSVGKTKLAVGNESQDDVTNNFQDGEQYSLLSQGVGELVPLNLQMTVFADDPRVPENMNAAQNSYPIPDVEAAMAAFKLDKANGGPLLAMRNLIQPICEHFKLPTDGKMAELRDIVIPPAEFLSRLNGLLAS